MYYRSTRAAIPGTNLQLKPLLFANAMARAVAPPNGSQLSEWPIHAENPIVVAQGPHPPKQKRIGPIVVLFL